MRRTALTLALTLPILFAAGSANAEEWSEHDHPTASPSQAIGSYTGGCLDGGEQLRKNGRGYQVMRLERNRSWGHPNLLRFIRGLGRKMKNRGIGTLLVGDMAQPRGGPSESSHVSHQTGLDVDLWYSTPAKANRRRLSTRERAKLSAKSVVSKNGKRLNKRVWKKRTSRMLRLAARSSDVERIMVNPVVKRQLCRESPGAKWLSKVRPWWGHADHFHVRLACPEGDSECKRQRPPAATRTGCDRLAKWFAPKKKKRRVAKRKKRRRLLPNRCEQVLVSKR
jgi:penicillin-insensitive murein endopeptidase